MDMGRDRKKSVWIEAKLHFQNCKLTSGDRKTLRNFNQPRENLTKSLESEPISSSRQTPKNLGRYGQFDKSKQYRRSNKIFGATSKNLASFHCNAKIPDQTPKNESDTSERPK